MRIETLYDQGTATTAEDRIIVRLPFVGVDDGVSGLYVPPEKPGLFDGRTGGQMAADSLAQAVDTALPEDPLEKILYRANSLIRKAQKPLYKKGQVEHLAGTVFALVKVKDTEIEIAQCGDCRILWVTLDGRIGITPNQVVSHEMEAREIIAELMRKHGGDRETMWQEFSPILATMRRQRINQPGGYGLLNGQPEALEMVLSIILPRAGLEDLLLWTDGLAYWAEAENDRQFGKRIFELYQQGGLQAVLEYTRLKEEKYRRITHIDHAEASGVAIVL